MWPAYLLLLTMCPGWSQVQDPKSGEWITMKVENFHPNISQLACEEPRDAKVACYQARDLWQDALKAEETIQDLIIEKTAVELKLKNRTPEVVEAFKAPPRIEVKEETPGWVWPVVGVLVGAAAIGGFSAGYVLFHH